MSELSDSEETDTAVDDGDGALVNGPESASVVAAVNDLLDGATWEARQNLRAASAQVGWAAVAHRLDVAGRALCADRLVDEAVEDLVGSLPGSGLARLEDEALLRAWCSGRGMAVAVDLVDDLVDERTDDARCWEALGVLTWLVDAAGYPAEVVV